MVKITEKREMRITATFEDDEITIVQLQTY